MTARKMKVGSSVVVHWSDPTTQGGWMSGQATNTPEKCVSRGFVVGTTKKVLHISHTVATSGGYLGVLSLPWGAVEKVKRV